MRISLVSDSKTGINFFPQLRSILEKNVADLECDSVFVPFPEDIPGAASALAADAEIIFVFVLYNEMDFKVKALFSKLIDIEMQSDVRIIKAIGEREHEQLPGAKLQREKEELAEKWGKFILDCLFKPEAFEPSG